MFAAGGGALYAAGDRICVLRWTPSDNGWEVIGIVSGGSDNGGNVFNAIYVRGNYLYIGGDFTSVIGPAATASAATGQDSVTNQCGDVAKLNLTTGVWSPVDDGSLQLPNLYNTTSIPCSDYSLEGPAYVLQIAVDASGRVYVGSCASDVYLMDPAWEHC